MPNDLTGDFDVVAEFSIPAANRLLAAMHRIERFPHSLAVHVADDPHPGRPIDRPTLVATLDALGDPPADQTHIGTPVAWPDLVATGDSAHPLRDTIVNADVEGANVEPLVPSHLRGRAQLQVAPPTLQLAAGAGNKVTVRLQTMARYFPDPETTRIAEFVHGELQLTASVSQVASQTASVVNIDVKANTLTIKFNPIWSSQPLTAEHVAGIEQVIRNALKTSFLPSNTTLPPSIRRIQFKTVAAGPGAIAVLLNMGDGAPGDPGSVNNVFLGSGDEFAFAAGLDFVRAQFQPTIDAIMSRPLPPIRFSRWVVTHTVHVTYTVSLTSAAIDLQGGKIVLTINGHAHTGTSWLPDVNFRVRQPFTLSPSGATVELVVGGVSLDITTGGVAGWLVSLFKGRITSRITQERDQAIEDADVRATVRRTLSADENLGAVVKSLLTPTGQKPPPPPLEFQLAYTAVEIRPSGIVLHGSLAVPFWPPPRVEFEQIQSTGGIGGAAGGATVFEGPDYSALKAWIPGGTIQRYDWSRQGRPPFHTDAHRFVLIHAGPEVVDATPSTTPLAGYAPLCLTISGVRLSASGPVVQQPVGASVCAYSSFPIVGGLDVALDGAAPLVALTYPGPQGTVEVAGHTPAGRADAGRRGPNLLVHFAGERTAGRLDVLVQALREAGRADAVTAVLAVMPADQLRSAGYTDGVIYAEDDGGAWERVFGVPGKRRPLTLVVRPDGKVVWQHEGEVDGGALAAALRQALVSGRSVKRGMLRSSLRIGQPPPNFLFDYAPGQQLTLRKLAGRPVTLVFWRRASRPSIDAVRNLTTGATSIDAVRNLKTGDTTRDRGPQPVVLAINDGDPPELVTRTATEHALTATTVVDPHRRIARAYGITVWPTTVVLDASGVIRVIQYGRLEH